MTEKRKEKIRNIYSIVYGLFTACILIFALLTLNSFIVAGDNQKVFFFFVFFFLFVSRGGLAVFILVGDKKNKIALFKNAAFALVYLAIAIVILALPTVSVLFYQLTTSMYLLTVIANRICLMFEKRKVGAYIYNSIIAFILTIIVITIIATSNEGFGTSYLALQLFIIIILSFIEVIAFAFAKIQLKGLIRIIRKTYVLEILYGLLILMVTFSFYFMLSEEGIATFWDGMWYSFAVVTTIGFGDLTVTSTLSRAFSVILGIYGIIVVASITSVIVNFYNETKIEEKIDIKIEETKEDSKEDNNNEN